MAKIVNEFELCALLYQINGKLRTNPYVVFKSSDVLHINNCLLDNEAAMKYEFSKDKRKGTLTVFDMKYLEDANKLAQKLQCSIEFENREVANYEPLAQPPDLTERVKPKKLSFEKEEMKPEKIDVQNKVQAEFQKEIPIMIDEIVKYFGADLDSKIAKQLEHIVVSTATTSCAITIKILDSIVKDSRNG